MFARPLWIVAALMAVASLASAFQVQSTVRPHQRLDRGSMATIVTLMAKKEDLSFIETRDMTREEMLQLNAENERIMNSELIGMTVFSLIISLPLLYLAWVGLFADTAEIAMNN